MSVSTTEIGLGHDTQATLRTNGLYFTQIRAATLAPAAAAAAAADSAAADSAAAVTGSPSSNGARLVNATELQCAVSDLLGKLGESGSASTRRAQVLMSGRGPSRFWAVFQADDPEEVVEDATPVSVLSLAMDPVGLSVLTWLAHDADANSTFDTALDGAVVHFDCSPLHGGVVVVVKAEETTSVVGRIRLFLSPDHDDPYHGDGDPVAALRAEWSERQAKRKSPPVPEPVAVQPRVHMAESFWWANKREQLETLSRSKELGSEPLFVYSLENVREALTYLKSLSSVNRVFYAIKANPLKQLLQEVHAAGFGFECVSRAELDHVYAIFPDLDPKRILFTPNFAPAPEYERAFELGVHVNLDNIWPLQHWPELFRGRELLVRVDLGKGAGHHAYVRTAGPRSKFGMTTQQLEEAMPLFKELGVEIVGLHAHSGSGIVDPNNWVRTAKLLDSLRSWFPKVKIVNVGGGLGVQYRPTDAQMDFPALDAELARVKEQFDSDVELWMEPGRYVVAQAGVILSQVTQLKEKSGKCFVGLDTGMNTLVRPALYSSYHHIVNLTRLADYDDDAKLYEADIVGPICESGDVLGHDREVPRSTASGDVMLIATAGAYGRCMSSSYNLRPPAREIIFEEHAS